MPAPDQAIEAFIAHWGKAEAAERANYQMFLTELCDLLELPHPDPAGADNEFNKYVFDRAITRSSRTVAALPSGRPLQAR